MKTNLMIGATLSAALWAGAAIAGGGDYNGNWPLTISGSQFYNGNYCLALSGGLGGRAELTGPMGNLIGSFDVFGRNLIADLPLPAEGLNYGEIFILPAHNSKLAKGTYIEDADGEIDNSGEVTIGKKNGC